MRYRSILFDALPARRNANSRLFVDLNLNQLFQALTAGREEYDLTPYFEMPSRDVDLVHYRQEVLRELEREEVFSGVRSSGCGMGEMRRRLRQAEKLHYQYQREGWFLDAVEIYCGAVRDRSPISAVSS